jgi:segregation and condensation protein A
VTVAELELDLEVFSGPFDLLLTLVLREEVDLLEVELADVVVTYLDFLEGRGELDLEVATEFLVLIAALLELKSRLMLPRAEEELLDLEPGATAAPRSTWPTAWRRRTATASAPRRCRPSCAA